MILVLNCGSSSLKFSLFDDLLNEVIKGIFERIGSHNSFCDFKKERIEQIFDTHKDALIFLFNKFTKVGINIDDIKIIGHRVAHGGDNNDSILVDYKVIEDMKTINNLAPLHNPIQMSVVEACMELFPNIKNSLSFDTAFHHTIPDFAYTYAIPIELSEKYSIKKYGFHGLSHEFVLNEYANKTGKSIDELNLIICHLGSGASICAIKNGKSIDTSMGFTPLEGLVMGTRSGDIDPSIPIFLARNEGMDLDEIENMLNKRSGLMGLTGMQNVDMREVLYLADYPVSDFDGSYLNEKFTFEDLVLLKKRCKLAIDVFVYRIKKYIGSYYFILGKVDAIIFTAGIGERSEVIRDLIIKDLPIGDTKVEVIATNEEKMIAMEASQFIK
ncbi:MAG TPA: acetate/propionate family kinase [bacterium]|nr:acetate/propionate family kinase [bacterium]